ncbi:DsrE family protein [Euzebya tangerina]|uniref:DsrE family protein n=1 Tax=Euzebya tangerina TaxID=591198 RepID=UPI000E3215BA|nr:DsrE family protein [Euzebya tangerina]
MSARTTVLVSEGDCWPLVLATRLRASGDVRVILLDRGADLARPGHPSAARVQAAVEAGVDVLIDTEALRRRGMEPTSIAAGIKPTDIAMVADLLVDETDKVVWL